ncbi:hypothetical protein Bbelb_065540 [Branchiostoma belcheri]|nr:hypothetical protein Bbelb_065540 [Branchiostoma belcheri]
MGIGGGAGVTASGPTEGNGPTGSVQPFKHPKTSDRHGSNKGYPESGYVSFNGGRYKSFTERKTRGEAVQACAADGGTLAMPKNSPTNTFLANLAKVVKSRWIGLTDANNDGHWVFEDGQTLESSGYANWRPGEPKPPNPRGGCAGFWSRGSSWSEQDCNFRRGFICQLSEVPGVFLGLENLEELELNSNAISVIPKGAFRGMPRLTTLHLEQNQLASVPVDALLLPPVLKRVNLQSNLITLVDNNVNRLHQNKQLRLWVSRNKWQCDMKLMWFMCNLSRLKALNLIHDADFLMCASPAEMKGRLLLFVPTRNCQAVTDVYSEEETFVSTNNPRRSEATESTEYEKTSTLVITKTIATYDKIPTHEDYTESSNDTPVSQHTTEVDQIVVILRGDAITHRKDNIIYLLAMSGAVAVPLLLVLALVAAIFVYKGWRGAGLANPDGPEDDTEYSETEGTERIEPYAVVYGQPAELQPSERQSSATDNHSDPAAPNQMHNDTIQPYAVAYAEDEGPDTGIKPYAVATEEDLAQNDKIQIPLYAVGGPDAPRDAEVDSAPLKNNTDQQSTPVGQSEAQPLEKYDVDIEPEYLEEEAEHGKPSTSLGKGPYNAGEEDVIPTASRIYGLPPIGSEEHGPSHALYSPAEGQPRDIRSRPSALYGKDPIDTAPKQEP